MNHSFLEEGCGENCPRTLRAYLMKGEKLGPRADNAAQIANGYLKALEKKSLKWKML